MKPPSSKFRVNPRSPRGAREEGTAGHGSRRALRYLTVVAIAFFGARTASVAATAIPQDGWTLHYVNSEETVREDGGGVNAFDGDANTFWHTNWSSAPVPVPPHEIQINLGAAYPVSGLRYLPRQDGAVNGRIKQYQIYVSGDGVNWGTAVATGTFPNSAQQQEVVFTPKSGQYVRLRALSEINNKAWTCVAEINVLESGGAPNQAPNGTIGTPAGNVTITAGDSVSFAGSGSDPDGNTPLSFLWSFGAGSGVGNSNAQNPGPVSFSQVGTFTVSLTVSDALGLADPTPATRTVTVQPPPPTLIPQGGWTLQFADSEETAAEDGRAINAFDGNANTFWHTLWSVAPAPVPPHEIRINLGATYPVSGLRYLPRQDGGVNGRIKQYQIYVSSDGVNWGTAVATGTFPNSAQQQEVVFTPKSGQFIRLRALNEINNRAWTCVAEINVLQSGGGGPVNQTPNGTIDAPAGNVTIAPGASVTFTGSGTDPDGHTPLTYQWSFGAGSGVANSSTQNPGAVQFNQSGTHTVTLTVTDALGLADPTPATRTITVQQAPTVTPIPQGGWSVHFVDSQQGTANAATKAFDGDVNTLWHTQTNPVRPPPPHEIQINLGATYSICGIRYLPRQDGVPNGRIAQYEIYVSANGSNWGAPVVAGTFATSTEVQEVLFSPRSGRYIRFRALSEINSQPFTAVAELNVLRAPTSANQPANGTIVSPAANATIVAGSMIELAGSGSDPDGDQPVSFRWTVPPGSGVVDSTAQAPGLIRFNFPGTYVVSLTVADARGQADPTPATRTITVLGGTSSVPTNDWVVQYVDSEEAGAGYHAEAAFDGNPATFWFTEFVSSQPRPPHEIQIDLGAGYDIGGFRYLPRQSNAAGRIHEYRFYVSIDGVNWGSPVAAGTFDTTGTQKQVLFAATPGRYVRLQATSEISGQPFTAVAELEVLEAPWVTPSIRLLQPTTNFLQSGTNLFVLADASLNPGQGVRLELDGGSGNGGSQVVLFAPPYQTTFAGLSLQPHVIDAYIVNAGGTPVSGVATHDRAESVGVGDYYVAIGNSITFGQGDDIGFDDSSQDGRNSGGGYEPILGELISGVTGRPTLVVNEGIPGARSIDGVAYMATLLQKHRHARTFLVMHGTNDTNDAAPVPSGLGLEPGDPGYAGSYKENMQRMINDINSAGKTVVLARSPAILPVGGQRDLRIQQLNLVVDELAADPNNQITVLPADMHGPFTAGSSIYYTDFLHPNGLGYQAMADAWFEVIEPSLQP